MALNKQGDVDYNSMNIEVLMRLVNRLQEAGQTEPQIDEFIKKIQKLQQAKKIQDEEMKEVHEQREDLQKELDKLTAENSSLDEVYKKKTENLRLLQFQCDEREAEKERQLKLSIQCKQRIEELTSLIQEEKLKQRKQRMEFEQQLEELMEKHTSTYEINTPERLANEITVTEQLTQQLLNEEKVLLQKLENLEQEMSSLGCTSITHAEDIFLRSQEAASAYQLFEEENKSVKRLLEEVSHYYSKLQQKHNRLVNELENQRAGNGNRNKIFTSVNKQIPSIIIRSED